MDAVIFWSLMFRGRAGQRGNQLGPGRDDCPQPHPQPLPTLADGTSVADGGSGRLFVVVAVVSIFTNLLMLTGPVFMLQVYDRVLSSRSEATLVVLFTLVAFLYVVFGLLDHARARIAARAGARYQLQLDAKVFRAALGRAVLRGASRHLPMRATQDVALLQQITGSPVFLALFDFPWVPLFIGVIALLHPLLGLFAGLAALALAGLSLVNMQRSRARQENTFAAQQRAEALGRQISVEAGQMRALGMQGAALGRWAELRRHALSEAISGNDSSGGFSASARAIRLFLQSAMLALGGVAGPALRAVCRRNDRRVHHSGARLGTAGSSDRGLATSAGRAGRTRALARRSWRQTPAGNAAHQAATAQGASGRQGFGAAHTGGRGK